MFYDYLFNISLLVSSITLWNIFIKNTKLSKSAYICLNLIYTALVISLIDNGIEMNGGSYRLNFAHIPIVLLILSGHEWFSLTGVIAVIGYYSLTTGFMTDAHVSLIIYLMVIFYIALEIKKRPFVKCKNWLLANFISVIWMIIHAVMFYSADILYSFADFAFIGLNFITSNVIYFIFKKIKNDETLFRKIKEESSVDFLTGVFNKRKFKEDYEHFKTDPETKKLTVCVFDIDYFKNINDTCGHPFGDVVLKGVANHLSESSNHVYRIGGEEFLMLFINTDDNKVRTIVEHVRENISKETWFTPKSEPKKITISAGIASCDRSMFGSESLINEADKKLYLAKAMGRNQSQY